MFMDVITPGETEPFFGGPIRSRCCRHQPVISPRSLAGIGVPLRRRLTLNQWSEWKALRRREHRNLSAKILPNCHCTSAEQRLDRMIEGFEKLLAFDRTNSAQSVNDGAMMVPEIQWSLNDHQPSEVHGNLQLPFDLRSSDDLSVELDESERTLTIRAVRQDTRSWMCSSQWEFSQRLDDSIELSKLEAGVNLSSSVLHLCAPLRTVSQVLTSSRTTNDTRVDIPLMDINGRDAHLARTDELVCSTQNDVGSSHVTIPINRRPVEIEDIGPDEESDKISTSSGEWGY